MDYYTVHHVKFHPIDVGVVWDPKLNFAKFGNINVPKEVLEVLFVFHPSRF